MRKKTKQKTLAGSIMVYTLTILFIILIAALGIAAAAVRDIRSSLVTDKSASAIQAADSGIEQFIYEKNKTGASLISDIMESSGDFFQCNSTTENLYYNDTASGRNIEIEMYDSNDPPTKLGCNTDSDKKLCEIGEIKSVGEYSQTKRALQASVIPGPVGTPIGSCVELANISDDSIKDYYLTEDINCSTYSASGNEPGSMIWNGWRPIRNFKGVFDGQGYTISNITTDITSSGGHALGIFGTADGATIKNVKFNKITISGFSSNPNLGCVVGSGVGVTIFGVGVDGCDNSSSASNPNRGCLAGQITGGSTVTSSYANCTIPATSQSNAVVGGLVGKNDNSTIEKSYSTGSVAAMGSSPKIGGLVGLNANNSTIANSYSRSSVSVNNLSLPDLGGLVGKNDSKSTISFSYSTGLVSCSSCSGADRGGFIGNNDAIAAASYFDKDTSSQTNACGSGSCSGVEAKTTYEMHKKLTYFGWDFLKIWRINEGNDYPNFSIYWDDWPVPFGC